jgi:hypothetical protein
MRTPARQGSKWRICRVDVWREQKELDTGEIAGKAGEDGRAGRF